MATSTAEALGLLGPAVWTPLYPGFVYDPARFRSQVTEEGFVYDPVFRFGTEDDGFLYDEHGFRIEATEEAVADDIASFCARLEILQGEAAALASSRRGGGDVADAEVAGDDDDALEDAAFGFADGFSHIIDLAEELLVEGGRSKMTERAVLLPDDELIGPVHGRDAVHAVAYGNSIEY